MEITSTGARRRWSRLAASTVACSTTLSLLWTGSAVAAPTSLAQTLDAGASAGDLVAQLSDAQNRIDELDIAIGDLRERANQALVDLHDAQSAAEQARRGAVEARRRLTESQDAVDAARRELDELTRSQYRNAGAASPYSALAGGDAQRDLLDRSLFLRQRTAEKEATLNELERARAQAANEESLARAASDNAERTANAASEAESQARSALDASESELRQQLAQRDAAAAEHEAAQQALETVRPGSAPEAATAGGSEPPAAPEVSEETIAAVESKIAEVAPDAPAPSAEEVSQAVQTALTVYNADSTRDSAAQQTADVLAETSSDLAGAGEAADLLANVTDQAAVIAAAAALVGSSQAEHSGFESPYGSSGSDLIAAFSQGLTSVLAPETSSEVADELAGDIEDVLPEVPSAEDVTGTIEDSLPAAPDASRVETVIARAKSMIGTPYVWGGGDANGPTSGLEGGQRGFDCSGLVLYAFAGAGISLPHYTGYQYQRGTQIDPSEAKRGDLLFWGNNGDSHVAIYLGDGTMIEAPSSGQNVRIAPVRWTGMSPKAVRLL